jgi:hypothetical protein
MVGTINLRRGRRTVLGKNISQIEMFNPESRRHLKDMLEAQIREKNEKKETELIL